MTLVDDDLCIRAAVLQTVTPRLGLGDRLCLALASRADAVALTAERVWQEIAGATVQIVH